MILFWFINALHRIYGNHMRMQYVTMRDGLMELQTWSTYLSVSYKAAQAQIPTAVNRSELDQKQLNEENHFKSRFQKRCRFLFPALFIWMLLMRVACRVALFATENQPFLCVSQCPRVCLLSVQMEELCLILSFISTSLHQRSFSLIWSFGVMRCDEIYTCVYIRV